MTYRSVGLRAFRGRARHDLLCVPPRHSRTRRQGTTSTPCLWSDCTSRPGPGARRLAGRPAAGRFERLHAWVGALYLRATGVADVVGHARVDARRSSCPRLALPGPASQRVMERGRGSDVQISRE